MSKEGCPAREICTQDLETIKDAFSIDKIKSTKGDSLQEGWQAFRNNESKLEDVGIVVEKGGIGRCDSCPISKYVREEAIKTAATLFQRKG